MESLSLTKDGSSPNGSKKFRTILKKFPSSNRRGKFFFDKFLANEFILINLEKIFRIPSTRSSQMSRPTLDIGVVAIFSSRRIVSFERSRHRLASRAGDQLIQEMAQVIRFDPLLLLFPLRSKRSIEVAAIRPTFR